jgi:putative copper export protein
MLVKHILVLGMLAIGFWFNAVLRVGPMMNSNNESAKAVGRFRLYVNMMAISGFLVLLLTAIAQVE